MRGYLHVQFGGREYPDPTIIMPLQCNVTWFNSTIKLTNYLLIKKKKNLDSIKYVIIVTMLYTINVNHIDNTI